MKKLVLIAIILTSFSFSTTYSQQKNIVTGAQVGLAVPVGELSDYANTGFGFLGSYLYGLNPNIDLVTSIGFISFSMKDEGVSGHTLPIFAGGRYYFGKTTTKFYGLFNIGTYVTSVSNNSGDSYSSTDFGFALGGGIKLPIDKKLTFDGNAKYNYASDYSWIDFFLGLDINL